MKTQKNENIKFEEALEKLEKIIAKLQEGNLNLDDSLKFYEEGIGLVRVCQQKLDTAESKITMLVNEGSADKKEVPFTMEAEG
ncbi:exodeoxyribonuclease 7 small subunit [Oxobacter pfennigii]|uniref:Exodeoxyribonuclease 7 small subunit n=1 Tax=Oxobacter pfennigii TaxID=36849 RepID=A0A0P8YYP0_9CLOT|nr:exodeoxyribonuclease VII small subunit [Oxobacter pfennigii]KPU44910.1 exodeoxyribonuclease 7 small subunit [Oxobacter pfennigii]